MENGSRFVGWASILLMPVLMGAEGKGCGGDGAFNSNTPAPDMTGQWLVDYDDTLAIEVGIGGAVYNHEISVAGGRIELTHDGTPLSFDLECERPEVVCPSEVWPSMVSFEHRNDRFPHRMWAQIPKQRCMGMEVEPDPMECGPDTLNPDCQKVCDGEVVTEVSDAFGLVSEAGDSFELLLGAGVATNGFNCALLGVSHAHALLQTSGSADTEDWLAQEMNEGEIIAAYAGGCLWAGDPDMDQELEALVISATVKLTTGFTGTRTE